MKYFAFDRFENHFDLFDTEKEAKEEAEKMLDDYRDSAATDGWPEEDFSNYIGWGEVKESNVCVEAIKRTDYTNEEWEDMGFGAWDEINSYELQKIEKEKI